MDLLPGQPLMSLGADNYTTSVVDREQSTCLLHGLVLQFTGAKQIEVGTLCKESHPLNYTVGLLVVKRP